ncbi:hypothetical protein BBK36DRAFT_9232 [Trichoderma citrinoviride]|uniref:Uncharacterized protein n=1 Tax=Trichoderma citrinoviride TaxID=58853 RepID=A0A2T4AX30_9HYPO|nr:hypothetical protein BBK36DRAFT_9232 [Trichoderma citrinoviride]PTB61599.1 hypothetical protein BBK36DRAFT_9232 [Trichoderma citrinoviride]
MVSKVIFMDGKYRGSEGWQRILPWSTKLAQATEKDTSENRMRWIIVERILTFSLRWEGPDDEGVTLARRKVPEMPTRQMQLKTVSRLPALRSIA